MFQITTALSNYYNSFKMIIINFKLKMPYKKRSMQRKNTNKN